MALACFSLGGVVLAVAPRNPSHAFFGFFTFLIGANFLFTNVAYLGPAPFYQDDFWVQAGLIVLMLDPAILLYFTTLFPRRTVTVSFPAVAAVGALVVALEVLVLLRLEDFRAYGLTPGRLLLALYMVGAYGTVLLVLGRNLAREPNPLKREQLSLMLVGFGTALIPRLALIPTEIELTLPLPYHWPFTALIAWTLLGLAAWWVVRQARLASTEVPWRILGYTAMGVGLITIPWVIAGSVGPTYDRGTALSAFLVTTQYPLRWIIFLTVVGYALLKYEAFDENLKLRPFATGTLVSLVVASILLGAYFFSSVLLSAVPGNFTLDLASALAIIIAMTLGFALLAGLRVLRNPRGPLGGNIQTRRLDVYRNALENTLMAGRDPEEDRALIQQRALLKITEAEHEAMLSVLRAPHAGRRLREPLTPGTLLFDRYEVRTLIGRGRSGRTFLAWDRTAKREVAIKEIAPSSLPGVESARDEAVRELAAAARIEHGNVIRIHEVVEDGAGALVIMEYAAGHSLAARLAREGRLSPQEAVRIGAELAAGLEAVHAAGLVHRDVKPGNILLSREGVAKLADFGVAHVPGIDETRASFDAPRYQPGTLRYMAPEQATGTHAPSPATDVYAAGAVLYECLTGRPYLDFRGRGELSLRHAIVTEAPRLPVEGRSDALNALLARALAKDPQDRFPTARALGDALVACPESTGTAPLSRAEHE